MDFYGFYTGQIFDAHAYLGAHPGPGGTTFRVFAPAANGVGLLLGDGPAREERTMQRIYDGNFYELTVPEAGPGTLYEYRVYTAAGPVDHCDPYGFGMELRPAHKSVVRDLAAYTFRDDAWMRRRTARHGEPLNIYEMHLGSWRRKPDGGWYAYEELAAPLTDYLRRNGYNYVEFLPLAEHPCDESWGYQVTGFFAPTSRYGDAAGLMALVDALHAAGIGVILDFVPAHFAVDAYGLAKFDGSCLYEYPSADVGVSEWGSCNFMHSRGEVRSFLQSAADFWISEYHMDGLRMDAVSRAIYWQGDPARGVNGNAVDFLRNMNQGLKKRYPDVILAAEDSTSFPDITRPAEEGGLGFDYKWDMGWMNDTLNYFRTAPAYRTAEYHKLTFSMAYYYQEQYLLPLSHDEVVHGKATIMQKMYGDYDGKFPQARAFYMYMYAHPGKKLNFMGNEIGQFREWDESREQDWDILTYPLHDAFHKYIRELNRLYETQEALYSKEYHPQYFQWLEIHAASKSVYIFQRGKEKGSIIAAFNFSDQTWEDHPCKLSWKARVKELLNSDWDIYSCSVKENPDGFHVR